jgi:hypothetical protein
MPDSVTFGSGFLGNKLIVHHNRVEIISGCFPLKRRRVIPFSNIASVETPRLLNKVVIHTNDGKQASFSVGNTKKMQQAILERM